MDYLNPNLLVEDKEVDLKFPGDVMCGVAGEFATLYHEYLEPPPEFFFVSFLTILGSLCNRVHIEGELKTTPRLFTLILGESADARKSTAIAKTVEIFDYSAPGHVALCHGVGSAEGLQSQLEETPSTILYFDEFNSFVQKAKIDSSTLRECVNTLFSSSTYQNRTKNTDIKINNAHLSLLAASTVDTYQSIYDESFLKIGFVNRVFIVPGDGIRKYHRPQEIPQRLKASLALDVRSLVERVEAGLVVGITTNADNMWREWYMSMRIDEFNKRLDEYVTRIAILLALVQGKNRIDTDTITKAIELCQWEYNVRTVYSPIDVRGNMASMEDKITRAFMKHGAMKLQGRQGLKNKTNAGRYGTWTFSTALTNLIKAGDVLKVGIRDEVYYKLK